jgi:hypothetical protein
VTRSFAAAAVATAFAALVAAPVAVAQGGSPFGPLAPQSPAPPPQQPAPQQPRASEESDDDLGTAEVLALTGVTVLLIGGVGVAIVREGRRHTAPGARRRRGRRGRRAAPSEGSLKRGASASRSNAPARGHRRDAKAPPPPPRKRRTKAKRR